MAEPPPIPTLIGRGRALLVAIPGQHGEHVVPMPDGTAAIGRHPTCDIVLDSITVARRHAKIVEYQGSYSVEDLRSDCGISVNGTRIQGQTELHDGDLIQVGRVKLRFRTDEGGMYGQIPRAGALS